MGRLIGVALLIGFISCMGSESASPSVLSPEKMETVLWDLLRAEQFTTNYVVGRDTSRAAKATGPRLYDAILKKHGTTDSLFRLSLDYYKKHPKLLLPILDSIGLRPDLAPTPMVNSTVGSKPDTTPQPIDPSASPKFSKPSPGSKLMAQ